MGIMRLVRVNGQLMRLSDLTTHRLAKVAPCFGAQARDFIAHMEQQKELSEALLQPPWQ